MDVDPFVVVGDDDDDDDDDDDANTITILIAITRYGAVLQIIQLALGGPLWGVFSAWYLA
jgi:hypothetical protein